MTDAFLPGWLGHPPLLAAILQRNVRLHRTNIENYTLLPDGDDRPPVLVDRQGVLLDGVLARDLGPDDLERIDFYASVWGARRVTMRLAEARGGEVEIWRREGLHASGPWVFADWVAARGAIAVATAADVMALFGQADPAAIGRRYRAMEVRGASRLRAQGAPATQRRPTGPGDLVVERRRQPYANFFAVEEYDLRFRRFDGAMSDPINRAAFISGDAVTVLPYDPVRDHVLLVEQFRAGPYARGDTQPWLLEAIAGRVDPGETPEDTARREAVEEAGLQLGALLPVANYYPRPERNRSFSIHSSRLLTCLKAQPELSGWRTRPRTSEAMSSPSSG